MRKIYLNEIESVSGAAVSGAKGPGIDPGNAQIIKDIAIDAVLGAMFTPGAPWLGGGMGAVGSVIHGAINHGPVNVPIPVLIGPSWNGSGGGRGVCRIQGGYQFCD